MYFRTGINFKVITKEADLTDGHAQHLSSTATCYSSVEDCPLKLRSSDSVKQVLQKGVKFADAALDRPDWKSVWVGSQLSLQMPNVSVHFIAFYISSWRAKVDGHFETIFKQWSEK